MSIEICRDDYVTNEKPGMNAKGRNAVSPVAASILLAASILTLLMGCASGSRTDSTVVPPVDETKLNDLLRQNIGRVVLLHFWATWCEPCVAEFPDVVRVAGENKERLVVIAVSIDDEEKIQSKVIPFLQKQAAPFVSYIKRTKDDEAFINNIDPKWSGAIPMTFIYRPDGTLVHRLKGQQTYEAFTQALQLVFTSPQEGTGK